MCGKLKTLDNAATEILRHRGCDEMRCDAGDTGDAVRCGRCGEMAGDTPNAGKYYEAARFSRRPTDTAISNVDEHFNYTCACNKCLFTGYQPTKHIPCMQNFFSSSLALEIAVILAGLHSAFAPLLSMLFSS
jgi:hypothetical protein